MTNRRGFLKYPLLTVAVPAMQLTGCGGGDSPAQAQCLIPSVSNLIPVPLTRQAADYTCGITAVQSILGYYGIDRRQDVLIAAMQPDPDRGTNYQNVLAYAISLGFEASARNGMTLDELKGRIDSRIPVLLAIQAWATPPVDWSTFENGHYVVAVGYDNDHFYFMDPSTLGHYTYIPIPEFLERWHDHDDYQKQDLFHFGIVMIKHVALPYAPDQVTRLE